MQKGKSHKRRSRVCPRIYPGDPSRQQPHSILCDVLTTIPPPRQPHCRVSCPPCTPTLSPAPTQAWRLHPPSLRAELPPCYPQRHPTLHPSAPSLPAPTLFIAAARWAARRLCLEQVWGIGWLTDEPRQLGEGAGGSDSLSRAGMCPGDRALPRRRGWGPVLPASSAQPLQPGVNGHQCPGGPSPSTDGQRRTLLISQVLGEERGALASQPPHLTCTGPSLTPRTPPVPMPLPAATDEPWRTRADHSLPTLHQ